MNVSAVQFLALFHVKKTRAHGHIAGSFREFCGIWEEVKNGFASNVIFVIPVSKLLECSVYGTFEQSCTFLRSQYYAYATIQEDSTSGSGPAVAYSTVYSMMSQYCMPSIYSKEAAGFLLGQIRTKIGLFTEQYR